MSVQERRDRERNELRRKILEASMDLISETGHEKLTIRDIARRIDYSPRTIYLYFHNKEHLMREVVEEGFRATIRRRAENREMTVGDPKVVLESQIRGHIAMAFSRPNLYRAIVSIVSSRDHRTGPAEQIVMEHTSASIAGLAGGRISKREAAVLSDIMLCSIRAFVLLLLNREGLMTEKERDIAIDAFIKFSTTGIQGT